MDQQQALVVAGLLIVATLVVVRIIRSNARRKLVREKLADGARVLDVRTPGEFGNGHYPGAVNIPLDKLPNRMKALGNKDSSIIVYCATGSRSRVAVSRLRAAGFKDVINARSLSNLPG